MNEDIRMQINLTTANGSATSAYMAVPYNCTLRDFEATCQGDPGDDDTITVTENSAGTSLGVYTFGSDIAAGATGTWVADSTDGGHELVAGEVIKFTSSSCAAAVDICMNVELDPACR